MLFSTASQLLLLASVTYAAPYLSERQETTGTATFSDTNFVSAPGTEDPWTEAACALTISDVGGWSGTFGPYVGECSSMSTLFGSSFSDTSLNSTQITIDATSLTLTFTSPTQDVFQCTLDGIGNGLGCDSWVAGLSPRGFQPPPPCDSIAHITVPHHPEQAKGFHLYKQISSKTTCGGGHGDRCGVGAHQSRSMTIDFSASFTPFDWISASFDVSQTTTTGDSHSCQGHDGQTVCIFKVIPFTAYNARNQMKSPCGAHDVGPVIRMRSPHKGGSFYHCAYGSICGNQGSSHWK